ncbi:hypothetical protein [Comamonas testosteroni]|uniref:hypothetical protein n=1 Tax=Comamonas testosteroni TaxID=285 RepID=UPI00128F6F1E|nr:hypothetical protein [Comamonas testosteroni]
MKVETGTVTILRISEVPHLDPIRVTLDDIGPGQGRINIECYGKAWASYWGAMGKDSIAEFFVSCSNDYLIGNLSVGLDSSRPSGDALERDAKRVIRHRRKGIGEWKFSPLTADAAEDLMNRVHELSDCDSEGAMWALSGLLSEIYGEDWRHLATCNEPNPEWNYLERICDAVREALKTQAAAKEGAQ